MEGKFILCTVQFDVFLKHIKTALTGFNFILVQIGDFVGFHHALKREGVVEDFFVPGGVFTRAFEQLTLSFVVCTYLLFGFGPKVVDRSVNLEVVRNVLTVN